MGVIKKIRRKLLAGAVSFSGLSLAELALAASGKPVAILCGSGATGGNCNIGGLENNLAADFTGGVQMFYLGAGIIGVAMIVIGLLKLKAHSMDSQGTSGHLRTAIWMLIIGALMLAVPVIMMIGSSSVTGSTVTMTSESGLFT